MSGGWNAPSGGKKIPDRRLSSSGQVSSSPNNMIAGGVKGASRRPLTAVLSEDGSSKHSDTQTGVKQSFLSKLTTRSDSKCTNINTISEKNLLSAQQQQRNPEGEENFSQPRITDGGKLLSSKSLIYGTECDNNNNNNKTLSNSKPTNDLENKANKLGKENAATVVDEDGGDKNDKKPGNDSRANREVDAAAAEEEEEEEDEDNQVIPSWPSKSDASKSRNSEFIQHKVYSLKDYSQVASPTTTPPISNKVNLTSKTSISSSGNKLLKSMSQDRKVKANTKRLSECLYLSTASPLTMGSILPPAGEQQQFQAATNKQQNPSAYSTSGSGTANYGLLPPNAVLLSESRIDRMRKLFVSPLSLRSHSGFSNNGGKTAAMRGAGHQRLSFQSGASSMLNKPHHLMHAMYRTSGGGPASSSSRRSPMRQSKQAKGFRVYGCPLQMANNIYPITCFGRADIYKQQSVPYVLARLCNYIEENSSHLTHEGIFRVSGNARLMEKLRTLFDHLGDAPLESESVDVATSASMLKMYLRELPEPLIPTRMNYYFTTLAKKYSLLLAKDSAASSSLSGHHQQGTQATSTSVTPTATTTTDTSSESAGQNAKERQRLAFSRDLTKLVRKLPIENYNLLKYLACFLYRISLKQQYNKMCAEALGIVFGPNVFRIRNESYKGLKEQELSNQIMASIISNYKNIFDSEITDPLGNLVEANEALDDDKMLMKVMAAAAVASASTPPISLESNESQHTTNLRGPMNEEKQLVEGALCMDDHRMVDPSISTAPMPSTSRGDATCCPSHCLFAPIEPHKRSHIATEPELRVCDLVGDDDDDDDDDDCDEGESYTPSSNSDSYCSSIGSETIETSSCEGDGQPIAINDDDDDYDGYNIRRHRTGVDDNVASAESSSECASDTSYTPTSSHSDSEGMLDDEADEADESLYGTTSSFESSLSLAGGGLVDGDGRPDQHQHVCRVCERRESAQLDRLANGKIVTKSCDTIQNSSILSDACKSDEQTNNIENSNDGSSRRRRAGGSKRILNITSHIDEAPEENDVDPPKAPLINHNAKTKEPPASTTEEPALLASSAPLAVVGHKRPTRAHHSGNRTNFLRRRSSSASSLGRVRQVATTSTTSTHGPRQRMTSEKVPRARHSSSRRARGRGHSIKRVGGSGAVPATNDYGVSRASVGPKGGSRGASNGVDGPRGLRNRTSRRHRHRQLPQRHGSSVEVNMGGQGGRHWHKEAPGYESYFMLRSFNSDETLLKSFNCAGLRQDLLGFGKAGRRFSGNETQHQSIGGAIYGGPIERPCDQIFEEDLGTNCQAPDHPFALGHSNPVTSTIHHMPDETIVEPSFEASFVSLLDNRLMSFRKSDVSINEASIQRQTHEDCIWVQMHATKELLRAMRRLQRQGLSGGGFTASMEQLVMKLSTEELNEYCDDFSASDIDYLSALSLIEQIEGHLSAATIEPKLDTIDNKPLIIILSSRIGLLKQRHTDLKAIRDHYLSSHIGCGGGSGRRRREQAQVMNNDPQVVNRSKSESRIHGNFNAISLDLAATNTADSITNAGSRKLSAPDKEIQASCSSSTSSLADARKAHGWPTTSATTTTTATARAGGSGSQLKHHQQLINNCKFGTLCPIEFVFNIEKQLAFKRSQGARLVKLNEMTMDQLLSEKLELQKNLLRYEHWFGRPTSKLEFSLVGHIYERYRAVKMIKLNRDQLPVKSD